MDEHMQRRLEKQKKLFNQLGIHLDARSIHEKVFSNKLRGYDPDEVDTFLDEVIKDYERFYATIADLMDKWQEQQIVMRELKAGIKPEPVMTHTIDPKQLEDIILNLEHSVKQLRSKTRPEQDFFID
ncbi:DivIVA domain-containing protein [Paenibacillus antarcticus]|uniref:Cell division protein n=1 Tax=Paenibacillus antarcticus TaxID=253703 RepID=A0A168MSC9_9BACL|nr:DivIVA domain-containing protein [Paenibacillus antarcticus]OAB44994.1 cell division protein [Paenibacillus antarcticus]